jgi:hypothetical protein
MTGLGGLDLFTGPVMSTRWDRSQALSVLP